MLTGRAVKRSGKWAYIINLPYDPKRGNYPQKWKSGFNTKKEAVEAMTEEIAKLENGEISVDTTRVEDYFTEWIKQIGGKVAPRTVEAYEYSIALMIPYIGSKKIAQLDFKMIEAMYNALEDREFALSTVHRVHRTLRAALNRVVRRGVLNVDQSNALLDWLKIHRPTSYVGSYLALFTGMRRGEICGLQWKNVDFDRGTIRVVQSRQRRYKEDIVGAPKTAGSTRSIPMGVEVLEMLLDWKHQHQKHTQDRGETWDETAYVVRRFDGILIDPMGLTHDVRLTVIALELLPVSFHDLRHTHATILLQANVPIKIVSERLGHASITMTADTYSHVTETMQKDATEKLSTIFRRENS